MKTKVSLITFFGLLLACTTSLLHADVTVTAPVTTPIVTTDAPTATSISSNTLTNEYTLSTLTPSIYSKFDAAQQKNIAELWHLTTEDYTRYLVLMTNTPNNVYYKDKNLDPSWILGFNAKDEQERQRYVVIAIQNERARIEKELAFQRDFSRLQQQLYPNQLPVLWTTDEENAALTQATTTKR